MRALPSLLFVGAIAVAFLAWLWHYAWSDGTVARRSRSPLWIGFSTSAAAALFVVAGLIGFNLDRHSRSAIGGAWSGEVIWWEVLLGLVLVPAAVALVRRGIRDLHEEVRAERTAVTRTQ